MILTGEPTEFKPYEAISDSHTLGSALSYVADQPFLVRSNSTSNYFDEETGLWITHIRRVCILILTAKKLRNEILMYHPMKD